MSKGWQQWADIQVAYVKHMDATMAKSIETYGLSRAMDGLRALRIKAMQEVKGGMLPSVPAALPIDVTQLQVQQVRATPYWHLFVLGHMTYASQTAFGNVR